MVPTAVYPCVCVCVCVCVCCRDSVTGSCGLSVNTENGDSVIESGACLAPIP